LTEPQNKKILKRNGPLQQLIVALQRTINYLEH